MLKKSLFIFVLFILALVLSLKIYTDRQLSAPLLIEKNEYLTLAQGTSFNHFSQTLVAKEWIETRFWLRNYVRLYPELAKVKAGTYLVKPNTSLLELLKLVVSGKEHQFQVTFIEGSTFTQWLTLLAQQPNIKHLLADKKIAEIVSLLAINIPENQQHPEGLFFPDTYSFTAGTSDIAILQRAYQRMQKELDKLWQARAQTLPYQSSYQGLIMASLIEKESGYVDEQPLIASVFVNRLKKKMRLQTDPTVIYGLGERYQGDIKTKHLKELTPYNTYRINGLPPTPIAMPGIKALTAAFNPASSEYLYFVSNGDGQHVFSKTLAEHNKAVQAYLLKTKTK